VEDLEAAERGLRRLTHRTIKKVTEDMEAFCFNTMIAALMEFNNHLLRAKGTALAETEAWQEAVRTLLLLLAPSCPHITEELWERLGLPYSIHDQRWPEWDPELAKEEQVTIVVQVNSRVRDRVVASVSASDEEVKQAALATAGAQRHIAGKQIKRIVYVPGKLVNIVTD
jgi:leucyl-tRNA synthetase